MMSVALLIMPFALIVFFAAIVIPIKLLLDRAWPDGPVKRFLFKKRG